VRCDSGVYPGWTVPIEYDPLLAKLSVWAETREAAIDRMRRALQEYRVSGITSNLQLFEQMMTNVEFAAGRLHTALLDEFMRTFGKSIDPSARIAAILAAAHKRSPQPNGAAEAPAAGNAWRAEGRRRLLR
jgi:acetyl-CoA carboxylase biotin carboxylase subunit